MALDGIAEQSWRFDSFVGHLEKLFVHLQADEYDRPNIVLFVLSLTMRSDLICLSYFGTLDEDMFMQYGRELHFLKALISTRKKATLTEKMAAADVLPCDSTLNLMANDQNDHLALGRLKARTRAVYAADLRNQLLGKDQACDGLRSLLMDDTFNTDNEDIDAVLRHHHELQWKLADDFLQLTSSLKSNVSIAGRVVKDDNQTLGRLEQTANRNRTRLAKEAARLERHAYRSWFDCGVVLLLLLVCCTFIALILVMRIFPKPLS